MCELGNWIVFSFHVYITTTAPSPLYYFSKRTFWKITKKRKYFPQTRHHRRRCRRRLRVKSKSDFSCNANKSTNCIGMRWVNFCVNSHNNREWLLDWLILRKNSYIDILHSLSHYNFVTWVDLSEACSERINNQVDWVYGYIFVGSGMCNAPSTHEKNLLKKKKQNFHIFNHNNNFGDDSIWAREHTKRIDCCWIKWQRAVQLSDIVSHFCWYYYFAMEQA